MMWFCGGHGVCLTGNDSGSAVIGDSARHPEGAARVVRALPQGRPQRRNRARVRVDRRERRLARERRLSAQRRSARSRARDRGSFRWRRSRAAPRPASPCIATPSPVSVDGADRHCPTTPSTCVGEPKLESPTRASPRPAQTFVYAQIVDLQRNIVVNNQATPVPVTLDGQQHDADDPARARRQPDDAGGLRAPDRPGHERLRPPALGGRRRHLLGARHAAGLRAGARDRRRSRLLEPAEGHARRRSDPRWARRRRDRRRPGARPHQGAAAATTASPARAAATASEAAPATTC